MDWPEHKHPSMVIGNLKSQVVIVTLWTPAEAVAKHIPTDSFALCAPLFSRKRGISPFVRTLLANKNIRYVIMTGADQDDVGDTLASLFTKGVDGTAVVDTDVDIDEEIASKSIQSMIKNVQLIDKRMLKGEQWKQLGPTIAALENKPSYGKPESFDEPKIETPSVFPGTNGGYAIHGRTLMEAHVKLLSHVYRFGEIKRHLNGQDTTKDVQTVLISCDSVLFEKGLPFTKKEGELYQENILKLAKGDFPYSIGRRMKKHFSIDQVGTVLQKIKDNAYTRKGILAVWDARTDLERKNAPGVMYVSVGIVDHKTVLTVHLRCMDAEQGIVQTLFGFRALQEYYAKETGFACGSIHCVVDNAYIDVRSLRRISKYVEKYSADAYQNKHDDPRGNIVISLKDGYILVTHVSRDDAILGEWKAKTAKEIYHKMADSHVLFDDYHKYDIGAELQKAEFALKEGKAYHQDRRA